MHVARMEGLSLISTYFSDSEDEVEKENENIDEHRIHNRLPLPESIVTWKGVPHHAEVVDDPSLHEGRIRSFKHERGNWASLVYLNYILSDGIHQWMLSTIKEFPFECNTFDERLHISVSKTLILKFHWIEPFLEDIRKLCGHTNRFALSLSKLRVYSNEERTRTFLGVECLDESGALHRFVKELDALLTEYGLPSFYEDYSYHVSLFWCLGDERERMNNVASTLDRSFATFLTCHEEEKYFHVDKVHFSTGNQLYAFNLL